LSDKLDRLTSLAKGDSGDVDPKDNIELLVKLSETLDRLRRLLMIFKRDISSMSPNHISLRLRETLQRLENLMGAYLKSSIALRSSKDNIICYSQWFSFKSLEIPLFSFQNVVHFSVVYLRDSLYYG